MTEIELRPLESIDPRRFESTRVLRQLNAASRALAELKGVVAAIPNQQILISTLGMQEAKDSSEIENIVTTHDELFRGEATPGEMGNAAAKEVLRYRQALGIGFDLVRERSLLTNNDIIRIQAALEQNDAGFRTLPGTSLKNPATGQVIYTPPQDAQTIVRLMGELEGFINGARSYETDPLIKMALIHHQFESIHPFYDGNGRTGRIINVLYLVKEGLLDIPVLYLSRHIVRTKPEYYRLLQTVRDADRWEDWVVYMLTAVESTAREGVVAVRAIHEALLDVKHRVREGFRKFYSQDLINHLFAQPYTRATHLATELGVSRITAARYLDALASAGVLRKISVGRNSYYMNSRLVGILAGNY